MTLTIPRWALVAAGVLAVAMIAFLIGRGSGDDGGDDDSGAGSSASVERLECGEPEMREAVATGEFPDAILELGAVGLDQEVLDVYTPQLIGCKDLTGDGVEEMVVEMGCCAGGAPIFPWAIYGQEEGGWTATLIRTRMPAPFLKLTADGVTERHGTFADGDPRCCPSGERQGTVRWDGSAWTFEPESDSRDRAIALDRDTPDSLGELPVQTANLPQAIQHFGVPSEYFRDSEICPAKWRDLGLEIDFVNLGGSNPCGPEGAVGSATIGGYEAELAGWRTNAGATLGITEEELIDLYPEMEPGPLDTGTEETFPGRLFHLVSRPSPIGDTGSTPSLGARLDRGTVTAYELYVGAGGE